MSVNNTAITEVERALAIELIGQRQQHPPQSQAELAEELKVLLTGVRNHAGSEQEPDELTRSLLKHLLEIRK